MKYWNYFKAGLLPVLLLFFVFPTVSSGKMVVGAILTGDIPYYVTMHEALVNELKNKLPNGDEVEFILQKPSPDPVAWSNAARKLVVGDVDLIISYGYPATAAALSKRSDIPIVYVGVYDPESVIKEGKITGCGYKVDLAKLLDYYSKIVEIKRLCVFYNHNEGDSANQMNQLEGLAGQKNMGLLKMDITAHKDLKILREIGPGDAVYVTGNAFSHVWMEEILTFLRKKQIPVVDIFPHTEQDGVLITLHQDPEQMGVKAASIAAKVLAGEKPEDVAPTVLTDATLAFNLNEATVLGVNIPDQLLSEASKVIK